MKTAMSFHEFKTKYANCLSQNELARYATPEIMQKLYDMTRYMLEINAVMNLTAITDMSEIIVKHLVDSLTIAPYISEAATVLDVGCGGGFPSLPLAIARPDLRITALDSTAKKTDYVAKAAARLGLTNLAVLTGRAEAFAHEGSYREQFDFVTARAVAALPILAELCIPFLKIGGQWIAMKGLPDATELTSAPTKLGGSPYRQQLLTLAGEQLNERRTLFFSDKVSRTPKDFPRLYTQIKKSPL